MNLYEKCNECKEYYEPDSQKRHVVHTMNLCDKCIVDLLEWAKRTYGEES